MRKWMVGAAVAVVVAAGAVGVGGLQAFQQQKQAAKSAAAPVDEDALFDDQLRKFGYWAGAAYQCVPDTKQAETEKKILDTYNSISRLFGTDQAFFFAAAFGNGTTRPVD